MTTSSSARTPKKTKAPTAERIHNYALWRLGSQDYTVAMLLTKLKQKYPEHPTWCEQAIEKLQVDDYLNDERFLDTMIRQHIDGSKGPNALLQKLYQKGFSRALIDQARTDERLQEKDTFPDAYALKCRHFGEAPITDPKIYNRAMGRLVRRGFDLDTAKRAMKHQPED
jgi:regulatory protein